MTNYFKSIIVGGINYDKNGINVNNSNTFTITNSLSKKIIHIDEYDIY